LARVAFKSVILEGIGGWGKGGAGRSALIWQEESMQIAVIGAGISGLVCARKLAVAGHRVVVIEKSRSLGGRCATRKFGEHLVDTGAQYFTLRDEGIRREIEQLAGGQLKKIEKPILSDGQIYRPGEERFYLANGNNRLGSLLAEGLEVRKECEVGRVVQEGKRWKVLGEEYDLVVSSAPWPQTAALFGLDPGIVLFEPNLTMLLEYSVLWDGSCYAKIDSSGREPLAWVACENEKAGRIQNGKSVFVVQTSIDYSREKLESKPEVWMEDLQSRLEEEWGLDVGLRGAVFGHRWRYARRSGDATPPRMGTGLYVCGDSVSDSRIESVWRNGEETAGQVLADLA
jgi:predicted NAD/FAD-dependent oxidoreductase